MTKSFKDIVAEKTASSEKKKVKKEEQTSPKQPVKESAGFVREVAKTELKEEVEKELRPKITEEVRASLEEEYKTIVNNLVENHANLVASLEESYKVEIKKIKDDLESSVLKNYTEAFAQNNKIIADTLEKLVVKIDSLQESLQIEIPTPVVHLTMPERNVVKKVHRDAKGNITHISEESPE